MQKILEKAFTVCLVISIGIVFILVISQMVALIFGNGTFMIEANDVLLTPGIVFAAIFSGIAFVLGYFPQYKE